MYTILRRPCSTGFCLSSLKHADQHLLVLTLPSFLFRHTYPYAYPCLCLCLVAQLCPTLCDPMDCSPTGSSVHGDSPVKNAGVGCHAFFQGIFPTEILNPGLPRCTWFLYHFSHQGSPRVLEWVAYPFARGSSQLRNQTRVSCIAGRFFTS